MKSFKNPDEIGKVNSRSHETTRSDIISFSPTPLKVSTTPTLFSPTSSLLSRPHFVILMIQSWGNERLSGAINIEQGEPTTLNWLGTRRFPNLLSPAKSIQIFHRVTTLLVITWTSWNYYGTRALGSSSAQESRSAKWGIVAGNGKIQTKEMISACRNSGFW